MTSTPTAPVPFDAYLPTCSGAPGTQLDAELLDFEGRRFLGSTLPGLETDPIRVYAGVRHGDAARRAAAVVRELVRLGAGERTWLVLGAPTGRGWVNHVLLRGIEAFTDGDVAIACSQFGDARSTRSTGLIEQAGTSCRLLLDAIRAEPELARCRVLLVGESFGAWTLTRMLPAIVQHPPHGLLLVATPGVARLDRASAQLHHLSRAGTRVVTFARPDDPVVAFPGVSLAWRPGARWRQADGRRWMPIVTLRRALRQIDVATRFRAPWRLDDVTRHDCRPDAPRLAAQLLDVHDDEFVARVTERLLDLEARDSTWLRAWGPEPRVPWAGIAV